MIHKYQLGGFNIVLDVNSGGVHLVDDLTYAILDKVQAPFPKECPAAVTDSLASQYGKEEIAACYAEIVELAEAGVLDSEDTFTQYSAVSVPSPIKALCLHVSHDCNLRCAYCFAATGDFGVGRKLMDAETGKKAIDFLAANSGDRVNLEVDFFGGEPLMSWNAVKEIVTYARSIEKQIGKKFRFTMTTNGMLLDDAKIDYLNEEMSNVVLSIDGRKEVHDRVRPCPNGSGSYERILPMFRKLVAQRGPKDYYVRGTFTKYNLDFSEDVWHLYEQGFDQISVEPVVAPADMPYALTEAELDTIAAEYEKLAQRMLDNETKGGKFNFFHFSIDLNNGPCAIKRLRGCGSGNDYVAITPEGDIYPCHQFVGIEDYRMGSIHDDSFNAELKAKFAAAHVGNKPECRECWAKFYCSGGCNANNFLYEGDILKPHKMSCKLQQKRLECAIMMQAARYAAKESE